MRDRIKLALTATLLLLPWIFFDIDLGDAAYHSLSSWLMAFHPKMPAGELPLWFEQVPVWFSYFVDSLWWHVIGPDASILATRFGWLIFQVLVLLGLFEAFRRLFPERKIIGPLLLGLLAVNCAADDFVLSYYVVPPAFGALAFAWLAVALKERRGIVSSGLAGLFLMLAIQSRLPAALPLLAATVVIFALDLLLQRDLRGTFKLAGGLALGLAVGGGIAILALFASGQAEYFLPGIRSFWAGVSGATNQRYSKGMVLERAVGHYARIMVGMLIFAPVYLLVRRAEKTALARPLLLLALLVMVLLSVMKYGTVLAVVIGGAAFLIALGLASGGGRKEAWAWALALGAGAILAAFTLGTFLEGIQTFKFGLWLLVPAAILIWPQDGMARRWFPGTIIVLFVVTRILWPTFPFLERPIYRMTERLNVPFAGRLYSYSVKSTSLEGVVKAVGSAGVIPGDTLFVYSGAPTYYPIAGIYLLTRTVPLLHDPGIVEYPGGRWTLHKRALIELGARSQMPRVIVRQKNFFPRLELSPKVLLKDIWTFEKSLPFTDFAWTTAKENWIAGEVDEILERNHYIPIWQDAYFVVLARP